MTNLPERKAHEGPLTPGQAAGQFIDAVGKSIGGRVTGIKQRVAQNKLAHEFASVMIEDGQAITWPANFNTMTNDEQRMFMEATLRSAKVAFAKRLKDLEAKVASDYAELREDINQIIDYIQEKEKLRGNHPALPDTKGENQG